MSYQPNAPWRFSINRQSKHMELIDYRHNIIMDFARYGMQNGQARFGVDGILIDAKDLAVPFPGRDHHASWCAGIDHPDARLIEAAPELLAFAREALQFLRLMAADAVNPVPLQSLIGDGDALVRKLQP